MSCSTTNSLLKKLGIQLPIIIAPMAGTVTPKLAAEVSISGGLGSVGLGNLTVENAQKAIHELRSLTNKPFNVNLFCYAPPRPNPTIENQWISYLKPCFHEFGATPPTFIRENYQSFITNDAMFEMLLEEKPPVISFHFGLPGKRQIDAFHEKGIILLATATSVDEAKMIEKAGLDAIVAQGYEAGGHRGIFNLDEYDECLGTLALVRLLVQTTSLPIIAAGGIMDGAGIDAALALGAQAVQMGTAFIGCPESAADSVYREKLLDKSRKTIMTRAFSGRPARGFINKLTKFGVAENVPKIPDFPIAYDLQKKLDEAAKAKGSYEFSGFLVGQGVPLARALPAAELIQALKEEFEESRRRRINII